MAKIELKAYIPSEEEYNKYCDKYRTFMGAGIGDKRIDGVYINEYFNNGAYFLRNATAPENEDTKYKFVLSVLASGLTEYEFAVQEELGLRIAFTAKYDKQSSMVLNAYEVEKTARIDDGFHDDIDDVLMDTSYAHIVTFGGKEYIWLNKDECEKGDSKTMECWSLNLVARAVPFNKDNSHNDFAKAEKLIRQCERVLTENCTDEELSMIVPVEMSDEDNYQKATPILEKENELSEE